MSEEERPEFDFNNDIAIDLDNLHHEWATHPSDRKRYADEISYLDKVVKKAHEKVKVTRSKLIKEASQNKELKLTSADLREAYYREHDDHKKAKEELIEAEYNLSMSWNALNAMDDRKYALQDEVKLWIRNYYATPREERMVESGKIMKEIAGEKVQTHREEMNSRRRRRGKV